MIIAVAILAVIGQSFFPPPSNQIKYFKPTVRPLTEPERWNYTVAISDAIGVGVIRKLEKTSPEPPPDQGIGLIFRETYRIDFEPIRWLKGDMPFRTLSLYCSSDRVHDRDYAQPLEGSEGDLFLVFAKNWESDLYLFENPVGYRGGAVPVEAGNVDEIGAEVAHSLARLSLDSLVALADLVVIGEPIPGDVRPCHAAGRESNCAAIGIESELHGSAPAKSLPIYGMYGAIKFGRGIYFLRETEDSYETFPIFGGVMPIENGHVEALGTDETTAGVMIQRISQAVRESSP